MTSGRIFSMPTADALDRAAYANGFKKRGARTWVRRTGDVVQLLNIQHSQWSPETRYLNFALWALALGEPPSLAERRFHFRTRADAMNVDQLESLLAEADRLVSLDALSEALRAKRISGLVAKDLRPLLG